MYEVYGTKGCRFCIEAARLLDRRELDYTYTDISLLTEHDKEKLQKAAGKRFMSVPQIFLRTEEGLGYIGGYTELLESFK
jgi:glutaredoxin